MAELGCLASTPLLLKLINYWVVVSFLCSCYIIRYIYISLFCVVILLLTYFFLWWKGPYIFSRTMPLAWDAPPNGLERKAVPRARFLYCLSAQRCSRRSNRSLRAAFKPLGCPLPNAMIKYVLIYNVVLQLNCLYINAYCRIYFPPAFFFYIIHPSMHIIHPSVSIIYLSIESINCLSFSSSKFFNVPMVAYMVYRKEGS